MERSLDFPGLSKIHPRWRPTLPSSRTSKPMIIRLCKDYFAIVMIAAFPPEDVQTESGYIKWSNISPSERFFTRDFLLVWVHSLAKDTHSTRHTATEKRDATVVRSYSGRVGRMSQIPLGRKMRTPSSRRQLQRQLPSLLHLFSTSSFSLPTPTIYHIFVSP